MTNSTRNPAEFAIPIINNDSTPSGVYIYLDHVTIKGIATLLTFWNIKEETRTNEFDNTIYSIYVYNVACVKPWALPGFYKKDGVIIQLGTTDAEGNRVITRADAEAYISVPEIASEIAGFGQTTQTKFIG